MSLYTRIPMPFIKWEEGAMRRMLCFLPVSGLVIGTAEALWVCFPAWIWRLTIGPADSSSAVFVFLFAVIACIIPVFLNGGIHLDGLADSADALASHASPDRKREILKDPHIGTFGVLSLILYEMIMVGIMAGIGEWFFQMIRDPAFMHLTFQTAAAHLPFSEETFTPVTFHAALFLLASVFVMSRSLVQIAVAWIPPASNEGMLFRFSSLSNRKSLGVIGVALLVFGQVLWVLAAGPVGFCLLPAMALLLGGFRRKMMREFGGISGDLCGRLLQISELMLLALLLLVLVAGSPVIK